MTLENQVVSLELSKRLKELGVKQESLFRWLWCPKHRSHPRVAVCPELDCGCIEVCAVAAFTVAELGELLKCTFHVDQPKAGFVKMGDNDWHAWINNGDLKLTTITAPTEADARAKMLIYLIENKLITV